MTYNSNKIHRILVTETGVQPLFLEMGFEVALSLSSMGNDVTYAYLGELCGLTGEIPLPRYEKRLAELGSNFSRKMLGHIRPYERGAIIASTIAAEQKLSLEISIPQRSKDNLGKIPSKYLTSLDELRNLSIGRANLGTGIASSLVSITRNPEVVPSGYPELVQSLYNASISAFDWTLEAISRHHFDKIVIFNGRFAVPQAISEAARIAEVELLYRENGAIDRNGYFLENWSTHNQVKLGQFFLDFWKTTKYHTQSEKVSIACSFYESKRKSTLNAARDFVGGQFQSWAESEKYQPKNKAKPRISYFSSSDDEYESLGDYELESPFTSQREAVLWLVGLANRGLIELIIRVHPHLQEKSHYERDWWDKNPHFASENVTVVQSASPVKSYEIMDDSDIVLTWHSTIGAESVYWGKPTVALCKNAILCAGADNYFTDSISELERAIIHRSIPVPDRESSFAFGYGMMISSKQFRWMSADDVELLGGQSLFVKNLRTKVFLATQNLFLGKPPTPDKWSS